MVATVWFIHQVFRSSEVQKFRSSEGRRQKAEGRRQEAGGRSSFVGAGFASDVGRT
jgi:hypothetical protein